MFLKKSLRKPIFGFIYLFYRETFNSHLLEVLCSFIYLFIQSNISILSISIIREKTDRFRIEVK